MFINGLGCCKSIEKLKKSDWMAFNYQLLNFYRTDSHAIFDIVFASLFDIIISKQKAHLSGRTRRKKMLKKGVIEDILETHCEDFRNCENYHSSVLVVESEIFRPLGSEAMITLNCKYFAFQK